MPADFNNHADPYLKMTTLAHSTKNAIVALCGVFSMVYLDNRWPEQASPAHQLKQGRHQKQLPDPFTALERRRIIDWMEDKPAGLYPWAP